MAVGFCSIAGHAWFWVVAGGGVVVVWYGGRPGVVGWPPGERKRPFLAFWRLGA